MHLPILLNVVFFNVLMMNLVKNIVNKMSIVKYGYQYITFPCGYIYYTV